MNLIWNYIQPWNILIYIHIKTISYIVYKLIKEFRILSYKKLCILLKQYEKKAQNKGLEKIQLNNYLFIIGRLFFGYISQYYMYKQPKTYKHINNTDNYNKNDYYKYFMHDYYIYIMIALQVHLFEKKYNIRIKQEELRQIIYKLFVEITFNGIQYIKNNIKMLMICHLNNLLLKNNINNDIKNNNDSNNNNENSLTYIKKHTNYKKQSFNTNINYSHNKNIWCKELSLKKDLRISNERFIKGILPNIEGYKKLQSYNHWNLYKQNIYHNPLYNYNYEGLYTSLIEKNKQLNEYLHKTIVYKEYYKKKIYFEKENIRNNFVVKQQKLKSNYNLDPLVYLMMPYTINFINQGTYKKYLQTYVKHYYKYYIHDNLFVTQTCNIVYIKDLHNNKIIPTLVRKIYKNTVNNITTIVHINTPEILFLLSKELQKWHVHWILSKHPSNNNCIIKIFNKNRDNAVEEIIISDTFNEITQINVINTLFLYNKKTLEKNPNHNNNMYVPLTAKHDIDIIHKISIPGLETTSIIGLYKNYITVQIALYYIVYVTQYLNNLHKMRINTQKQYLQQRQTDRLGEYLKTISKKKMTINNRIKIMSHWYNYILPIHIQKLSKKSKHNWILYASYIVNKDNLSLQYLINHNSFSDITIHNTKTLFRCVSNIKNNIYYYRYTKNTFFMYKKDVEILNMQIQKELLEYICFI